MEALESQVSCKELKKRVGHLERQSNTGKKSPRNQVNYSVCSSTSGGSRRTKKFLAFKEMFKRSAFFLL